MKTLSCKRQAKYRAVPTTVDGIRFASKLEAKRWAELKMLERCGEITNLKPHPKYDLRALCLFTGENKQVCRYVADFEFYDVAAKTWVTEDCKGIITETAKLKLKWFAAQYGRSVRIIRK